jgi:hypothetical protein
MMPFLKIPVASAERMYWQHRMDELSKLWVLAWFGKLLAGRVDRFETAKPPIGSDGKKMPIAEAGQ